jgi:hypothetical protein
LKKLKLVNWSSESFTFSRANFGKVFECDAKQERSSSASIKQETILLFSLSFKEEAHLKTYWTIFLIISSYWTNLQCCLFKEICRIKCKQCKIKSKSLRFKRITSGLRKAFSTKATRIPH